MKIVKQSTHLIWITSNAERVIERCGRLAYKSEDKITESSHIDFIKKIIKLGHESVLEHACASILFVTDRGVTHEMVRHRIASYTQESTRYCNYSKDKFGGEITVIKPNDVIDTYWYSAVQTAEYCYLAAIKDGCSPQMARSMLSTCLKTEIIMTANFREWRHFFKVRCAAGAHPQMRELAFLAWGILKEQAPTVFNLEGICE